MTINSNFGLHEQVFVKALKIEGFVSGILKDSEGIQYRVVYFWDGIRRQEWMYGNEISELSTKGFSLESKQTPKT